MDRKVDKFTVKIGNKYRLVYNPSQEYKYHLRRLKDILIRILPVHPSSYGWVPGKSPKDAALKVVDKLYKLRIDLHDFFHSIPMDELYRKLSNYLGPEKADYIINMCTYDNKVPQGFPTSPVLANFYRYDLDVDLTKLASENDVTYINYGDDLIFAANIKIPMEFTEQVYEFIQKHGLQVNKQKTRFMPPGTQQKVLGIIVNQKLNFPKKQYEALYDALHKRRRFYYNPHIAGKMAFLKSVNPRKFGQLFSFNHLIEIKFKEGVRDAN